MAKEQKTVIKQFLQTISLCDKPITAARLAHELEMPLKEVAENLEMLKNYGAIREVRIENLMEEWK
jgi:hypothetical protein